MQNGLSEAEAYLMIEAAHALLTSNENNHVKLAQWLAAYERAAPLMQVALNSLTDNTPRAYFVIMHNDKPVAVTPITFGFVVDELKVRDEQPDSMRFVHSVAVPMIFKASQVEGW